LGGGEHLPARPLFFAVSGSKKKQKKNKGARGCFFGGFCSLGQAKKPGCAGGGKPKRKGGPHGLRIVTGRASPRGKRGRVEGAAEPFLSGKAKAEKGGRGGGKKKAAGPRPRGAARFSGGGKKKKRGLGRKKKKKRSGGGPRLVPGPRGGGGGGEGQLRA